MRKGSHDISEAAAANLSLSFQEAAALVGVVDKGNHSAGLAVPVRGPSQGWPKPAVTPSRALKRTSVASVHNTFKAGFMRSGEFPFPQPAAVDRLTGTVLLVWPPELRCSIADCEDIARALTDS